MDVSRWDLDGHVSPRECEGVVALCGGFSVVQPNVGLKRTGVNIDLLIYVQDRYFLIDEDGFSDLRLRHGVDFDRAGPTFFLEYPVLGPTNTQLIHGGRLLRGQLNSPI